MSRAIVEHDITVHQGDVREQLALLPAGSVNCIVTSPPYYGLRDYGVGGQIGLEPSPAEYVAEMVAVFREARRVLADDGVLWLNIGDSYSSAGGMEGVGPNALVGSTRRQSTGRTRPIADRPQKNLLGIPWRVAFALQDDGWTLRNAVIWNKPNAMPESVTDRLSCRYEHVFLFSKSRRYWFDLDAIREPAAFPGDLRHLRGARTKGNADRNDNGSPQGGGDGQTRNPGDVWTISTIGYPGAHFATMPPALAERCILAGCPTDGTVLDPFAGSGTTLMVARKLARKAVGIELNPDYTDIIRQRIGPTPFEFGEETA
jgi:site-specific DNA-methyltransferase (cytosine-N4-specific)